MKRLEIKTRNLQLILLVVLGLFMVPLGLLVLINELRSPWFTPARLMVGLMPIIIFGAVAWLFRRAYIKSVKYFSDEGLVLNNGKSFAWTDLSQVVNQVRLNRVTNAMGIWRTELQFKNGESAWLLPTKISNFREVYAFVRSLPCEHTEVKV
jgi:hypothetical protein